MPGTQLYRKVLPKNDPKVTFSLIGPIRQSEDPSLGSLRLSDILKDLERLNKLQFADNWMVQQVLPLLAESLMVADIGLTLDDANVLLYKHFHNPQTCRDFIILSDALDKTSVKPRDLLENVFPEALRSRKPIAIHLQVRIYGPCRQALINLARPRSIPLSISTADSVVVSVASSSVNTTPYVKTVDIDDDTIAWSATQFLPSTVRPRPPALTIQKPLVSLSTLATDESLNVNHNALAASESSSYSVATTRTSSLKNPDPDSTLLPVPQLPPVSAHPAHSSSENLSELDPSVAHTATMPSPFDMTTPAPSAPVDAWWNSHEPTTVANKPTILRRPSQKLAPLPASSTTPPELKEEEVFPDTLPQAPKVNPHTGGFVTRHTDGTATMTSRATPRVSVSFDPYAGVYVPPPTSQAVWRSSDLSSKNDAFLTTGRTSVLVDTSRPSTTHPLGNIHEPARLSHPMSHSHLPRNVNDTEYVSRSTTRTQFPEDIRLQSPHEKLQSPQGSEPWWSQFRNRAQVPLHPSTDDILLARQRMTEQPSGNPEGRNDRDQQHESSTLTVPPRYEPDWTKIHLTLSDHHIVNPKTNSILPWLSHHPEYGLIKSHPTPMNIRTLDQELFLSLFQVPFNADKNQKNTFYQIPHLDSEDDIFSWYQEFATLLNGNRIYVPPLHTQNAVEAYGEWYHLLPEHTKYYITTHHSRFIKVVLQSSKAGLSKIPTLAPLVNQADKDGYQTLLDLLAHARHPLLTTNRQECVMPRQSNSMTLIRYIELWRRYLYALFLESTVLSDRHFLDQFINRLHSTLRHHFASFLEHMTNRIELNRALPMQYSCAGIYMTLMTRAMATRLPVELITKAPTESARPQQVRGLHTPPTAQYASHNEIVAAIERTGPPAGRPPMNCALCDKFGHMVTDCPQLAAILGNKHRTRLVSGHLRGPRSTEQRAQIRQVLANSGTEDPSDDLIDLLLASSDTMSDDPDQDRQVTFEDDPASAVPPTMSDSPDFH